MSLPESVNGDGPLPPTSTPTPPLPVITFPETPVALTLKFTSCRPFPPLPLMVLLTTPTVIWYRLSPPKPLLCTTLPDTSAHPPPLSFCTPQASFLETVQALICRPAPEVRTPCP